MLFAIFYDSVALLAEIVKYNAVVPGAKQSYNWQRGGMPDNVERLPVLRVSEKGRSSALDSVVTELSLAITLNNHEVAALLCSPTDLDYLAVGFLFSEGLIETKDDIKGIEVEGEAGAVRVEARKVSLPSSRLLVAQAKLESDIKISAAEVFALVDEFVQRSAVFKATGGVHSAALCDAKSILVFNEDIGRHNAIDKVFGECLLKDIPTAGHLVITSGRVSSEILLKVAKRDVPVLISKAAPTSMGVRLAGDLGMTLIGFVRGKEMNIYTNERRVVAE